LFTGELHAGSTESEEHEEKPSTGVTHPSGEGESIGASSFLIGIAVLHWAARRDRSRAKSRWPGGTGWLHFGGLCLGT